MARLYAAGTAVEVADERSWTRRSSFFWEALASGNLGAASASPNGEKATMPGVTTMWIGTLGRGLWGAGRKLGLWDVPESSERGGFRDFIGTRTGLDVAQGCMAVVVVVLLGVLVVLVTLWAGRIAGATVGLLLATEPFLVAQGAILHTDELVAFFAVGALVAWALALGLPHPTKYAGRRVLFAATGVLYAGAVLTKLTALTIAPSFVLLGLWALARSLRARGTACRWRRMLGLTALTVACCVAVIVVAYPALWVDPVGELRLIQASARLGSDNGAPQFFRGKPTATPGPLFFGVALPLRMTPWFVAATVGSMLIAPLRGQGRRALVVAAMGVPTLIALSFAGTQYDRYGVVVVTVAAVLVGLGAQAVTTAVTRSHPESRRVVGALACACAVVVSVHALIVAPWAHSYFNPALGGADRALELVPVGSGEGMEEAGEMVAELADGHCDGVTVRGYPIVGAQDRCGRAAALGEVPTYVVVYIRNSQTIPAFVALDVIGRPLLKVARLHGIPYLQIYGPPKRPRG
jgi:hypothetical protein